jgi:acyl carrier protein
VQNESGCAQRVIDVIVRTQKLSPEQVTIDSEFAALGIDSIDAVEILFELESEFSIEISNEQMQSVRTVRHAAEAVDRLLTANASGVAAS